MQSLKARFNGNSGEVVKYAREFGIMAAMEHYQVKDYLAMLKFLKEQAPNEEFQAVQVNVDNFSKPDAFDKLLEAMLRKYAKLEAANKNQADRINELEKQIAYFKGIKWQKSRPLVQGIMQYCEGK